MQKKYFSHLQSRFPQLGPEAFELISDRLISPYTLTLPKAVLEQAQLVVRQLYALRENPRYQQQVGATIPALAQMDPGHKSICMSYDFHLSPSGNLKLIEVNTNASFLLMSHLLYECQQQAFPVSDFSLDELRLNCLNEARLAGQTLTQVAIVDEAPRNQRLFIEFLLYQQLFADFGWPTVIADPAELSITADGLHCGQSKIDFVYNRTTDFYFSQPTLHTLAMAYQQKLATISPNPHEYALLADKQRLIDWSLHEGASFSELAPIQNFLLKTAVLTEANSAEIWAQKKKFFFKPMNSFGSKGSFRGEGISRTYFDQFLSANCLAQEYCPAGELLFEAEGYPATKLKYDLRFYAYQDRVQTVIARLYQGQVTNLRAPLGGFAPVVFT